jgi:uncharacterized protein (TIGR02246 family)
MRSQLLIVILAMMFAPMAAIAGPKEDAFLVVLQFQKAFEASNVEGVVKLFSKDAVFLGTLSPKLATTTADIDTYFQSIKTDMPRKLSLDATSSIVISNKAVLFAGLDTFSRVKDGKRVDTPARFTFLVSKGDQGWRISHFHSSARPSAN